MKEVVEKYYDKVSEDYDKTHSKRFVDDIFEHFMIRYLPKRKKLNILDAGGGIGRFSFPLVKSGHKIVLTDISKGMVEKAKKLAKKEKLRNIDFFKESVTDMKNQKNNSFDVVLLMNGVLDYCKDYKKALRGVKRVLKKRGILIGTVNNRFVYSTTNILIPYDKNLQKNIQKFKNTFRTGNYKSPSGWITHDFNLEELKKELDKQIGKTIEIFGVTNLVRKWEYPNILTKENWKDLLRLQIKFAKKKEFINNSNDFLFIAEKK